MYYTSKGRSKRIPLKNIKRFNGKPIIYYSIKSATSSNLFDKVIVSTDNNKIAQAKKFGAETHTRLVNLLMIKLTHQL